MISSGDHDARIEDLSLRRFRLLPCACWPPRRCGAQNATPAPQITDNVFKNIQLLKGIPVDTFFDAMGMFANAMGNDCTFCHSPTAALDRDAFAVATPRIQRARQMILMVNTINKMYFGGEPRVTCFTCHHGTQIPRTDPNLALQYGPPIPDPIARDFETDTTIQVNQVFDKHLQAIGGAAAVNRLTSFTAKGTYEGFDTAFDKVPVEIFAKAPNQLTTVVQMSDGVSRRVYNGSGGWLSGPDTAIPVINLTDGNLDRARLEAIVAFPRRCRRRSRSGAPDAPPTRNTSTSCCRPMKTASR